MVHDLRPPLRDELPAERRARPRAFGKSLGDTPSPATDRSPRPTPSEPTLSAADQAIFDRIEQGGETVRDLFEELFEELLETHARHWTPRDHHRREAIAHHHIGPECCVVTARVSDRDMQKLGPVRYQTFVVRPAGLADVRGYTTYKLALEGHRAMVERWAAHFRSLAASLVRETHLANGRYVLTEHTWAFTPDRRVETAYVTRLATDLDAYRRYEFLELALSHSRAAALVTHDDLVREQGGEAEHQPRPLTRNSLRVARWAEDVVDYLTGEQMGASEEGGDHAPRRGKAPQA